MLDFNDPEQVNAPVYDPEAERQEVRAALLARLPEVLRLMFPAGTERAGKFFIGDIRGTPGDSLEFVLDGEKAGLWHDRAEGIGGDIFDAIAGFYRIDVRRGFASVLGRAADLLRRAPLETKAPRKPRAPTDDLGPPTAQWRYLAADGRLLAVVYRYDPPGRGKEFRPWDVVRRKPIAPTPRPLYNLPGILKADTVVLAEGEKCADALVGAGVCGTTAMHGANAPVDKTDWSPLAGKHVLAWPDKDQPGWDYAVAACQAALAAGALSAHILLPPEDKPEGWDAADAVAEGFDVTGFIAAGPRMPVLPQPDMIDARALFGDTEQVADEVLAAAFTRHHADTWRYCADWGRWLYWDGKRWVTDRVLHVMYLARRICLSAAQVAQGARQQLRLGSASTIAAVERLARCDPAHAATADAWDNDPWLLNTASGAVDLRTGEVREHRRNDYITKLATASATGKCPTWEAFLRDVTGGDDELRAYLQRMAGYCLTGVTSEHALFFLYGTGGNGKSVFINTLTSILGDYATNAPMETFMESRGDRHPTELAGLRGARFVSAIETEQGRRWNESKIKAITGGDKVSARFMRQDFFDYVPQFKLVIAGNHKPSIRNVDEAMRRRLHLVPFTVTIPKERRDGRLTEKLLAERDGILAWALQGCLEWQRQGLRAPECVVSATEEYFEAEDALGQWMAERCVIDKALRCRVAELYADWREWAEAGGEYVGSVKRFVELLLARKFEKCRFSGGVRGLVGLALRHDPIRHARPYKDD